MSDAIQAWLTDWGECLDELMSAGIATMSDETRQRPRSWAERAEELGWAHQAEGMRAIAAGEGSPQQRVAWFMDLNSGYELARRLWEADQLAGYQAASDP